jgi:hypothetical protein
LLPTAQEGGFVYVSGLVRLNEHLGRRTSHRLPVILPALIRVGEKTFTAKLTNIARGGAKFETSAPILAGAKLTVCCGAVVAEASVVWRNAEILGVNFDARLSDDQVQQQVTRSAALAALAARRTSAIEK